MASSFEHATKKMETLIKSANIENFMLFFFEKENKSVYALPLGKKPLGNTKRNSSKKSPSDCRGMEHAQLRLKKVFQRSVGGVNSLLS